MQDVGVRPAQPIHHNPKADMFNSSSSVHVTFIAIDKIYHDAWPKPVLAADNKPEWYKNLQPYVGGKPGITSAGGLTGLNPTMKQCMPILDMMTAGYHILLPCDVYLDIDRATGQKKVFWPDQMPKMIKTHNPEQIAGYPIAEGYEAIPFKWFNPWIVRTPPGWSCIFQHPSWHDELPFRTLPAIVDTDRHDIPVEFPYLLKSSFTGCIAKDTPIAQVIPFKRQDTKATYTWDQDGSYKVKNHKFFLTLLRAYQKFVRQKKSYSIEEAPPGKCPFSS